MKTYKENKEAARRQAIDYQNTFGSVENMPTYYSDIIEANEHFEKIGKRYGLLKEFKENGML